MAHNWGRDGRWGKYYKASGSSAHLCHDLGHSHLWPENWRTHSGHIFPYKGIRLFKKQTNKQNKRVEEWIAPDCNFAYTEMKLSVYLLMYKWGTVKHVLCTVISKCNFYSKSMMGKYYLNSYSWCLCARLVQSTTVKRLLVCCALPPLYLCFPFRISFFRTQWCPCKPCVRKTPHGSDFYYILQSRTSQNKGAPQCVYIW